MPPVDKNHSLQQYVKTSTLNDLFVNVGYNVLPKYLEKSK